MRWRSLREVLVGDEEAAEMRTLLSYRRDLVREQARGGGRFEDLLEFVQNEGQLLLAKVFFQTILQGPLARLPHPQRLRNGGEEHFGLGQGGERGPRLPARRAASCLPRPVP
jgi:hypothetical protein